MCKILFLLWMVEGCIIMVEISCFQSVGCALLCIFFDGSHTIVFMKHNCISQFLLLFTDTKD